MKPKYIKQIFFNDVVINSKYKWDKNRLINCLNSEVEFELYVGYDNNYYPNHIRHKLKYNIKDFTIPVVYGDEPIKDKIVIQLSKNICFKKEKERFPEYFNL